MRRELRLLHAALSIGFLSATWATAGEPPRPGWTKAVVSRSEDDSRVTVGEVGALGGETVRQYEAFTVISLPTLAVAAATERAAALGLEFHRMDEWDTVRTPGAIIDTRSPMLPKTGIIAGYPGGVGLYVVQWDSPLTDEMNRALSGSGLRLIGYVPFNGALVFGSATDVAKLGQRPEVQWSSLYHPAFRAQPAALAPDDEPQDVFVQVVDDPGSEGLLERLRSMSAAPPKSSRYLSYRNERLRIRSSVVRSLLSDPYVVAIEYVGDLWESGEREAIAATTSRQAPPPTPEPYQDGVRPWKPAAPAPTPLPDYRAWLTSRNVIDTSAFSIAFADSGLTAYHPDIHAPGRPIYYLTYIDGDSTGFDVYGHGTPVIGMAAGDPASGAALDPDSFHWAMGVAPKTKIVSQRVIGDEGGMVASAPPMTWANDAYNWGCTVQTHSWNQYRTFSDYTNYAGKYTTLSQEFDVFVRDTYGGGAEPWTSLPVTAAVGNICGGQYADCWTMVLPPATAKNVLAVGATESWRRWTGQCAGEDYLDESLTNIASMSRRGTEDGRFKPDIVAPGALVSSARLAGKPTACFDVVPYPTPAPMPANYTVGSGTSYSAPQAAAAYVLLTKKTGGTPCDPSHKLSPAMLKAAVVGNSLSVRGGTVRCNPDSIPPCSAGTVPPRPNAVQGFGRLYLGDAFGGPGTPTQTYLDECSWAPFTGSGQVRSRTMSVVDQTKPTVIVVAWTDEPALVGANPTLVRQIDMYIQRFPYWYSGNQIGTDEFSLRQTYPQYDQLNNVEMIVMPPMTLTTFALRVKMVLFGAGSSQQKFAVFASNAQ